MSMETNKGKMSSIIQLSDFRILTYLVYTVDLMHLRTFGKISNVNYAMSTS